MANRKAGLDFRAFLARRLRFLPRKHFSVAFHCLYQGELTTLREPKTFNQLVASQNMKPYDALISRTTDKYAVRQFIAETVGERYLVPLIQVVDNADDLDLDNLPGPCVIKATHGYDMNIFVKDVNEIDRVAIRSIVREWLSTDFYGIWKERPYINLVPRCIVEQLLGGGPGAPDDYKFHMYNGKLGLLQVHRDRLGDHRVYSFDANLNRLAIKGIYPVPPKPLKMPPTYREMVAVAEKLSANFELVRVDLYSVNNHIYVGEITHNPGGGLQRWNPKAFDRALGDFWREGTPIPRRFRMQETADTP